MKRNLLIISLLVLGFSTASAQIFKKGDGVGSLTLGLGNARYPGLSSSIPAVGVAFDYGVMDNIIDKGSIGIGGLISYGSYKESYYFISNYSYSYSSIVIGPRGTFHYQFVDKLDTYAALTIGFNIVTTSGTAWTGYAPYGSTLITQELVGARYYFSDKIAVVGELGFGIAYLNLGLAIKLK